MRKQDKLKRRYVITFAPPVRWAAALAYSASFLSEVSGPRRADQQRTNRFQRLLYLYF